MIEINLQKQLQAAGGEMLLDINLSVPENSFVSVFGKSGAGKTTLLKMLAGLTEPDEGTIHVGKTTWYNKQLKINLPPQKRKIGFVFQDYALFPNMTVKENLEFVITDKSQQKDIKEILELTGLLGLSARYPSSISGGQQQRLALARALIRRPDILLLDEPMSALDHETRLQMQDEISKIHRQFGLTTIMVSHEPSEIFRMSDMVAEIDSGKIIRSGSPEELFHQKDITGKFQLTGEVLDISLHDIVYIARIISGNRMVKVVITGEQATTLNPGDKVLISSKAFNPVVIKI